VRRKWKMARLREAARRIAPHIRVRDTFRKKAEHVRRNDRPKERDLHQSTNVTLLISFNVVQPSRTFARAESRRNIMPSSFAAFLISAAGRRSRIKPRIRSKRSSNS